jgi:hypothetical protein
MNPIISTCGDHAMKWLFSAVCGGLVLALAVSFPRAQETAIEKAPVKEGTGADKGNPIASDEVSPDAPADGRRPGDKTDSIRDPSAKFPAIGKSATKRGDVAKDAPQGDGVESELKIFELKRASADSARKTIMQLYPEEFMISGQNITADTRTNSLLVRAPRGLLRTIHTVLKQLDESSAVTRDDAATAEAGEKPQMPRGREPSRHHHAEAYREHEDHAARQAAEYRNQLAATPSDRPKLERLKTELQEAVRAAFDARQKVQRAEMERLRGRLAQIERRIEGRQQRAQEIIDSRVEELLHPEKQWEAGEDATDPAAPDQRPDRAGSAFVGERDPTQIPLGARSAIATARVALAEAEKELALARDHANFVGRLEKKGYTQAAQSEAAAADLAAKQIRLDKAKDDLAQAEHEAALMRDDKPRDVKSSFTPVERPADPLLRERAFNPRKALLDAESAMATARASAAQADRALAIARDQADVIRKAYDAGTVPTKELHSAERDLAAQQSRRERALVDLEQAERQAALAREDLAAQIDLLKIDLEEARLQFENASQDEQRAKNLLDRGAMSKEEYVAKALAEKQAELQVGRATRLFDLYRKALPNSGSAVGKTTTDESAPTKRGDPFGTGKKE